MAFVEVAHWCLDETMNTYGSPFPWSSAGVPRAPTEVSAATWRL